MKLKIKACVGWCKNPETGKALEDGKTYDVDDAPFWRRRIREGVVEVLDDPAAKARAEAEAKAEAKAKAQAAAPAK